MKYKSLNRCIVYRATKFELFASKVFPYYIPFISKRKRAKIRRYWKNRWKTRLNNDLVKLLSSPRRKGLPLPTEEIKWYDWEWEIINDIISWPQDIKVR